MTFAYFFTARTRTSGPDSVAPSCTSAPKPGNDSSDTRRRDRTGESRVPGFTLGLSYVTPNDIKLSGERRESAAAFRRRVHAVNPSLREIEFPIRGFVSPKDYPERGIPAGKEVKPLATVEILQEKDAVPRTLRFLPSAQDGGSLVAVEVSSRPDAILVEKTLLDELRADAKRIADATREIPTVPVRATPAKPKEAPT